MPILYPRTDIYTRDQIQHLLDLVEGLRGSGRSSDVGGGEARTFVSSAALAALGAEADRLVALKQELMIGTHEHRHGVDSYLYLAPEGLGFGVDDFKADLGTDFEEGESAEVNSIGVVLFEAEDRQALSQEQAPGTESADRGAPAPG